MGILTDEEMKQIHADTFGKGLQSFARAIEAAVLSKLAEQAGEPVADVVWFDPALELFTERKPHKIIDGSLAFMDTAELGTKLYTEAQYIAAQQRVAEACAKAALSERLIDNTGHPCDEAYNEAVKHCATAIRNGEWRKYL